MQMREPALWRPVFEPLIRPRVRSLTANWGQSLESAIRSLFPDVWYDPSDLTTLYQDSAGTTPVTTVEQPVGLMLDKSKGLVLGSELVANGDFSAGSTGWSLSSGTVSGGALNISSGSAYAQIATQVLALTAGNRYKISITVSKTSGSFFVGLVGSYGGAITFGYNISSSGTFSFLLAAQSGANGIYFIGGDSGANLSIDNISVKELPGAHAFHTPGDTTTRPVYSKRINAFVGTETLATQSVTTLADEYTLSFTGTGSITLSGTATGSYSAGTHTVNCTAGTLTATVSGSVTKASLVPSDLAGLPYQRVNTATDYDASSVFPAYLRCDGTNDGMQTNAIDFSSTDKMTVVAAVRKLSDAAVGQLIELSASVSAGGNTGSFSMPASDGGATWTAAVRGSGSLTTATATGLAAPISTVNSSVMNLTLTSGEAVLRINGAQAAASTTDAGSGNFGNYPLYLFRRDGSSLPFNGWFYGGIIKGATLTAAQIALVERYLAGKTKTVVLA